MIALPAAAFVCSAILTALVRHWAVKTDFVSHPREDRYNRNVIALGGGIAIFWTIALFVLAGAAAVKFLVAPGHLSFLDASVQTHAEGFLSKINDLLVVIMAVFILHLMGLWDDKRDLNPFVKLAIQFAVAIIAAVYADVRAEMFIENKFMTTVLSVFWIVLMINAFNFLDNMDGASTGIALIATAVFLWSRPCGADRFLSARWDRFSSVHCWGFCCLIFHRPKFSWVTAAQWSSDFLWPC